MFERIHQKLGTAGFIISIVALVAALGGGAYAATGGGSGATASAKAKQGKPGKTGKTGPAGPAGPVGPAGPQGAAGAKGDAGAAGSNGGKGTDGTDGTSVTTSAATVGECPNGGTKFTSASPASKVCNGAPGAQGATGATGATGPTGQINTSGPLPVGKTETGAFSIAGLTITTPPTESRTVVVPISFPIPLANELTYTAPFGEPATDTALIVKKGASGVTHCPGTASEPEADSGYLCVYLAEEPEIGPAPPTLELRAVKNPNNGSAGAGKNGALILLDVKENQTNTEVFGTWATTG